MKMIKFPLLLLLSIFLLTDCKKDTKADNPDATADEITDWLKIDGAVKKLGNPPSPTVGAPVLTNLSPTTGGVTDGTFAFKFSASDDFEGIYLKVKGADSYLDIPLSSTGEKLPSGKIGIRGNARKDGIAYRDTTGEIIVILDLDEASNPEEFCYEYCLYDAENEVSNIVEVCVTIADWGGLNQLVGKWKYDKAIGYADEDVFEIDASWGRLDTISCNDTVFIVNQYDFTEFFNSGAFLENNKSIIKSGISCPIFEFYNNQLDLLYNGKWSYNPATNGIIIINYELNTNQGTPVETLITYEGGEVLFDGIIKTINATNLVILKDYGSGYSIEDYFIRY
jgi:hypothetical protein